MTHPRILFVLGYRAPVGDGIADYCDNVARELELRGRPVEQRLLPWRTDGWRRSMAEMDRWPVDRSWCVLHFTNLSWSRRGVPFMLPVLVHRLQSRGARVAVRFHDPHGHPGTTLKARARRLVQERLMHQLAQAAELSLHNVPPESAGWLKPSGRSHYIPVGSNVPNGPNAALFPANGEPVRVAVFCISEGPAAASETAIISETLRNASSQLNRPIQLVALGAGTKEAEATLRERLQASNVTITCHGHLAMDDVARELRTCHALLFVRGPVCTQRTTVLAGVANGLPVVGVRGAVTSGPILDAGVCLAEEHTPAALARAIATLCASEAHWAGRQRETQDAFERHFSWARIAEQYSSLLR